MKPQTSINCDGTLLLYYLATIKLHDAIISVNTKASNSSEFGVRGSPELHTVALNGTVATVNLVKRTPYETHVVDVSPSSL